MHKEAPRSNERDPLGSRDWENWMTWVRNFCFRGVVRPGYKGEKNLSSCQLFQYEQSNLLQFFSIVMSYCILDSYFKLT